MSTQKVWQKTTYCMNGKNFDPTKCKSSCKSSPNPKHMALSRDAEYHPSEIDCSHFLLVLNVTRMKCQIYVVMTLGVEKPVEVYTFSGRERENSN